MENFKKQFESLGIKSGDSVLVHSSMKALKTKLSPREFIIELIEFLGESGTLLFPALSYQILEDKSPTFSLKQTPPCIGLLPIEFLKIEGVKRSMHPTHSVSAIGKNADLYLKNHFKDRTPVGENSPFIKLAKNGGKILMIGNVNRHNTLMHGAEEFLKVPYVLNNKKRRVYITDENGNKLINYHKTHDFSMVSEVYYEKIEDFMPKGSVSRGKIGSADCTLISAKDYFETAVSKLKTNPYEFVKLKG